MPKPSTLPRVVSATAGLTALLLALAGCATESPPKQSQRLQKAAGLKVFYIDTSEELWKQTSKQTGYVEDDRKIKAKVHKLDNGLARVELTGVGLANYLRVLDHDAHGGSGNAFPGAREREPESIRMYDEIAKKIDSVKRRPAASDPPLKIVVDDAFVDAKN